MPAIALIESYQDELTAIRRDLHAHPEIGFEETRTAGIVAQTLREWGVDEVHEGIAGTGIVGIIHGKQPGERRIGLRADMDALPITETTNLPYSSRNPGKMHACGHDGHTTILLGTARYLAATRNFAGTAVLIFLPAEEGLGGARRMIAEGLFERFPCDELYGLHNDPNTPPGRILGKPGAAMAGASFFDIVIEGTGSHAAMPHQSRDPIVIATQLVQQLQTIVSRNTPPLRPAVLSVTQIHAGAAYNVVPDSATLAGTIRYFDDAVIAMIEERMRAVCAGIATGFGVEVRVDIRNVFDVLMNDPDLTDAYLAAAADVVGAENAVVTPDAATGSEDFADMLKTIPGSYLRVGHAGDVPLHNPGFVLDDGILPIGASLMARIVERRMPV